MIGRPCKPDADLKGLWRMLLGTPFPACGMSEEAEPQDGGAKAGQGAKDGAAPSAKTPASRE
jgi:hypothetical protein